MSAELIADRDGASIVRHEDGYVSICYDDKRPQQIHCPDERCTLEACKRAREAVRTVMA